MKDTIGTGISKLSGREISNSEITEAASNDTTDCSSKVFRSQLMQTHSDPRVGHIPRHRKTHVHMDRPCPSSNFHFKSCIVVHGSLKNNIVNYITTQAPAYGIYDSHLFSNCRRDSCLRNGWELVQTAMKPWCSERLMDKSHVKFS